MATAKAPLWPDGQFSRQDEDWLFSSPRMISPLEGEMAGRPEGGIAAPAGQ